MEMVKTKTERKQNKTKQKYKSMQIKKKTH